MSSPFRRNLCIALVVTSWASTSAPRVAAEEDAGRRYEPSRGDEDWTWLQAPHATTDFWDPVKLVRLGPARDDLSFSFGGETRQYFEYLHNELWGSTGHANDGDWQQRYMVHGALDLTSYLRVFAQLKSGIEIGHLGGPSPVDQDALDVNQAFIEVAPLGAREKVPRVVVRLGRQEMAFGSGRLVDLRDGPVNVRSSYDGVRILARLPFVSVDAFLTRPDLTKPGVFDDGWDTTQRFWGAWATVTTPAGLVDAYYLGLDRLHGGFERGSGHEERHTVGARVVVQATDRRASLEAEGAYQLGRFQGDAISAWMCVLMGTLRPPRVALAPELALGVGAASGDAGAQSRTLGTFNPLFPTGSYFGMIGMNGAPNHIAPRATITLHAPKRVTARAELMAFWRESLADGVYSVPGFLLRPGAGNPGRYLGAQVEPYLTWEVDRHLSLTATAAYFWVGDFFRFSQPGRDVTYAAMWGSYRF